jgi:hypothetical protein
MQLTDQTLLNGKSAGVKMRAFLKKPKFQQIMVIVLI